MKKHFIFIFIVFVFMLVTMPNVHAASYTLTQTNFDQAKAGTPNNGIQYYGSMSVYVLENGNDYVISGDIDLGNCAMQLNNGTIELNNATLTSTVTSAFIYSADGSLLLKGSGTINGAVRKTSDGSITISDNIIFNSQVILTGDATHEITGVINGGTFNAGVQGTKTNLTVNGGTFKEKNNVSVAFGVTDSTTTIKGGTFTGVGESALYIVSGNTTIEGGTFTTGGRNGIETQLNPMSNVVPTVIIKGGTFTGTESGFTTSVPANTKLSGGTFKATTSGSSNGALRIMNANFANILETGYKYSVNSTTTTGVYSANEVSIISDSASAPATPPSEAIKDTTNNPKTGDNIILYIVLSLVSITGLVGLGIYTKKKMFN